MANTPVATSTPTTLILVSNKIIKGPVFPIEIVVSGLGQGDYRKMRGKSLSTKAAWNLSCEARKSGGPRK